MIGTSDAKRIIIDIISFFLNLEKYTRAINIGKNLIIKDPKISSSPKNELTLVVVIIFKPMILNPNIF